MMLNELSLMGWGEKLVYAVAARWAGVKLYAGFSPLNLNSVFLMGYLSTFF